VTGGRQVSFSDPKIKAFATEITKDEMEHVRFFRSAPGGAAVAQPAINLDASFKAAAKAAGLGDNFDPYASDQAFLRAAFVFEDVGVTAFKGAAPLISNKTYLGAAAGVLAVAAYHAGLIRTTLYGMGIPAQNDANAISKARGSLDGVGTDDQGISVNSTSNIVPSDNNGIAFGRTPGHVLNIVYLNPGTVTSGGFPNGVNGTLNQSGGSASSGGTGSGATPSGGRAPVPVGPSAAGAAEAALVGGGREAGVVAAKSVDTRQGREVDNGDQPR